MRPTFEKEIGEPVQSVLKFNFNVFNQNFNVFRCWRQLEKDS